MKHIMKYIPCAVKILKYPAAYKAFQLERRHLLFPVTSSKSL